MSCSKVFCTQCAYFNSCRRSNARVSYDDQGVHETCNAPQNIRSTYLSDGSDKYISSPSIINKYNNCCWFIAKSTIDPVTANIDLHNKNENSHPTLKAKVTELDSKYDLKTTQTNFNLNQEITRATNAEKTLSDRINVTIDTTTSKPILTDKDNHKYQLVIVDGVIKAQLLPTT